MSGSQRFSGAELIISDAWTREEDDDLEEESVMMVRLEKDLRSKNISELEREHFYEKLMVLKQEQAAHIRLVERVYRSEVYTEHPRGILKTNNLEVMQDNIEWELFAFSCHNSAFFIKLFV